MNRSPFVVVLLSLSASAQTPAQCTLMKVFLSSATEQEVASLFKPAVVSRSGGQVLVPGAARFEFKSDRGGQTRLASLVATDATVVPSSGKLMVVVRGKAAAVLSAAMLPARRALQSAARGALFDGSSKGPLVCPEVDRDLAPICSLDGVELVGLELGPCP